MSGAVRVAVAGATGYAGAGCVRLLSSHPGVELVQVSSRSQPGRPHCDAYPGSPCQLVLSEQIDPGRCDVVLSAQAPGECARQAGDWLERRAVVIDLSADFRLRSADAYRTWYGAEHPSAALLAQAVLALPELDPAGIAEAALLALPGCFTTAVLLACGPAVAANLVHPDVVVDGKTGVSGAGRNASAEYLFSEVAESVLPYQVSGHRHRPEMEQALGELGGQPCSVTFVPHLVPMVRGLVATCYLRLQPQVSLSEVREAYAARYQGQPFVRLSVGPVASKAVSQTNLCYVHLEEQGSHLVATAVLDNLGRGASGQAVQVLNLRFGMSPQSGLPQSSWWP